MITRTAPASRWRGVRSWGAAAAVLAIAAAFAWWIARRVDREMRVRLLGNTAMLAASVDREHVKALAGSLDDLQTHHYQGLKAQFNAICEAGENCRFVYLLGQLPDGTIFFHVDSEPPDSDDLSRPGEVYAEASPECISVFETGQPIVEGPLEDRWGVWVTAFVPLFDPKDGTVLAVLGMDIDARDWRWEVAARTALPVGLGWVLILATIATIASRRSAQVIRAQQAAMMENEETYRALVQGLPDTIQRFDPEGRHLFVSDNVSQMHGIPADRHMGKTHRELGLPADHCAMWEAAVARVFAEGKPYETDFRVERNGSPTRIYDLRLEPELDAGGRVRSVLSISRDVTVQKRTEEEYQTLFREMLDGFALHEIICNESGIPVDYRFLAVNPAFERMTGLKAGEIVGSTVLHVMPAIEHQWIETYGKVAQTGEPISFEQHAGALGKHFRVTAFRPAPGQFACMVVDITEHRAMEEQLAQAQKMESVGRLAGGVAHDFNNMLGVILGRTELALDQDDLSPALRQDLLEIRKAADRSAELTRQLLAFARRQIVTPKVLDLNEAVAGMTRMLQRLIGENIDLVWNPAPNLWPVRIDPSQVDQVLANLCVNARDAIDGLGRVRIETANATIDQPVGGALAEIPPGQYVMLIVSDDGRGMDEATLAHIFEPFFTTKPQGKGTGLGLAMVYGAIRQNKGFVDVASEPGRGTTFRIYLPRYAAGLEDEPAPGPAPPVELRGSETILLVEDEPAILNMVTLLLQRLGYTVLSASRPEEALRIASTHSGVIDLLISDIIMPGMDGLELAKLVSGSCTGIRRLFMSGYTADVIAHHGVLDPGMDFIEKPFSIKDLGTKVREILDR